MLTIAILFSLLALKIAAQTVVSVSESASHAIPTTLWGIFFEDINGIEGGLYAELLQNRAFQIVTPGTSDALRGWHPLTDSSNIEVVASSQPVSNALPNSLSLTVEKDGDGFANEGFWGIKVNSAWTYKASLYYKVVEGSTSATGSGVLSLGLSPTTNLTSPFVSKKFPIQSSSTKWTKISTTLKPSSSADNTANYFTVSISGLANATIEFALLSLFPPTFKGRENGLRIDLAEALVGLTPTFYRFPGGTDLGGAIESRWQWNTTVGPLLGRPGRQGFWGYVETGGFGLYEYLTTGEDFDMVPIMGIWDGYTPSSEISAADMGPYIAQAIDQINFVTGDPALSQPAALRAKLGHPKPFALNSIEIGNEDFLGTALLTAQERWKAVATNLTSEFPDFDFMATTVPWDPVLDPVPKFYDVHVYESADWFANNSFYYDSFERNGTLYFEGEYAAISTNNSDIWGHRLPYPTLQSAIGEAAFMTGLERNSDIVFAASYAPMLQHVNSSGWSPDLISFDAERVYLSTSYYTQKLFSNYRGDKYISSTLPNPYGNLTWTVNTRSNGARQEIIFKIINYDRANQTIRFELPKALQIRSPHATGEILTGPVFDASNSPETPDVVGLKHVELEVGKKGLEYAAPGLSFTVLTAELV
ncbi:glycoside hydrolase family 51 protein [Flagelloscypha sp. PMI_526]|nr:glycoside hydrolase family 51 protein [Flagelloscypha sp. PMI_526]